MLSFEDVPQVRRFVAERGIEFISFYVSDIDGRTKGSELFSYRSHPKRT